MSLSELPLHPWLQSYLPAVDAKGQRFRALLSGSYYREVAPGARLRMTGKLFGEPLSGPVVPPLFIQVPRPALWTELMPGVQVAVADSDLQVEARRTDLHAANRIPHLQGSIAHSQPEPHRREAPASGHRDDSGWRRCVAH